MSDQFVAEVRIFAFNFAPTGWAFANGQLLPISQNTALFAILGTFYGGDGKSTFALPDLQGRAAMNPDQGPGLSDHFIGEASGVETVTLLESEIPLHSHSVLSAPTIISGDTNVVTGNSIAKSSQGNVYNTAANIVTMAVESLSPAGGDLPHNNMQPYLTMNFCIALQGVFPPRC